MDGTQPASRMATTMLKRSKRYRDRLSQKEASQSGEIRERHRDGKTQPFETWRQGRNRPSRGRGCEGRLEAQFGAG